MRRALALLLFIAGCHEEVRPDTLTAVRETVGLRPDLFVVLPGPKGHVGGITIAENETATPVALTTALAAAQVGPKVGSSASPSPRSRSTRSSATR